MVRTRGTLFSCREFAPGGMRVRRPGGGVLELPTHEQALVAVWACLDEVRFVIVRVLLLC